MVIREDVSFCRSHYKLWSLAIQFHIIFTALYWTVDRSSRWRTTHQFLTKTIETTHALSYCHWSSHTPWILFPLNYMFQSMERCLVYKNITGYLKNHWTRHRLVCTHFDEFSMLIPSMGTISYNSHNFILKFLIFFPENIEAFSAQWFKLPQRRVWISLAKYLCSIWNIHSLWRRLRQCFSQGVYGF